jgi:uncharacterized membrane protein
MKGGIMRRVRFIIPLLLAVVLLAGLFGCATDTPWRKATVTTYELLGVGIVATKDTTELLKAKNVITDAQLLKIKDVYNKTRDAYAAAGKALKLAGQAASVASRDASLAEYAKLLADFNTLSTQLYDLIKGFKKVSYNEVLEMVRNGGDPWLSSL